MLQDEIDNVQECRSYSASSSPTQEHIEVTVKLVPQPVFSKHLQDMPIGHVLESQGPFGDFFFAETMSNVVLIGAGSGIAPLRSIVDYIVDKKIEIPVTVIVSDKTKELLLFQEEFESLQTAGRIRLYKTLTSSPDQGRINSALLASAIPDFTKPVFFICGPPPMVDTTVQLLKDLGAHESQIKVERFR